MSKEAFREHHTPMYEKQKQVEQAMLELQGEIDALRIQSLDNSQVIYEAQNLQKRWKSFSKDDKRNIIEAVTKSIKVGKEDIEINLAYIPTILENNKEKQHGS